jgi:hypothetical protein
MAGHIPVATEVHLPLQSQFVKRHKQLLQKCLEHVSECSESKQRQSTSSHMSRGYKSKELSMQLKRQSGPSLLIDGTKTRTNAIILLLGGRSRTTGYGLRTSPIQRQMTKSLCLVSSWSLRRSAARLCSSNVKYRQVPCLSHPRRRPPCPWPCCGRWCAAPACAGDPQAPFLFPTLVTSLLALASKSRSLN